MHERPTLPFALHAFAGVVKIGDVEARRRVPDAPELVPVGYLAAAPTNSQEWLAHLRWLLQKEAMAQDVFVIGPPGATRRRLVLSMAELVCATYVPRTNLVGPGYAYCCLHSCSAKWSSSAFLGTRRTRI